MSVVLNTIKNLIEAINKLKFVDLNILINIPFILNHLVVIGPKNKTVGSYRTSKWEKLSPC